MHWSILAACWPLSMPAQGRHPSASSKHNEKHLQLLPITPGWDHWFKRTQISPFLFYNTPLLNGHSHWLGFVKISLLFLELFLSSRVKCSTCSPWPLSIPGISVWWSWLFPRSPQTRASSGNRSYWSESPVSLFFCLYVGFFPLLGPLAWDQELKLEASK